MKNREGPKESEGEEGESNESISPVKSLIGGEGKFESDTGWQF